MGQRTAQPKLDLLKHISTLLVHGVDLPRLSDRFKLQLKRAVASRRTQQHLIWPMKPGVVAQSDQSRPTALIYQLTFNQVFRQ
jgi:hypothetical protein